jgi:Domain of unknown function (DUF4281)
MTASTLFQAFNSFALIGWILMIAGVVFNRPYLRDTLSGIWFPVILSAGYTALIIFFFAQTDGGYDSLENVQKLFAAPWIALAGWLHYLAFDMFVGSRIARQTQELGLTRWPLIALLPITFLFGPIGYLAFEGLKAFKKGSKT